MFLDSSDPAAKEASLPTNGQSHPTSGLRLTTVSYPAGQTDSPSTIYCTNVSLTSCLDHCLTNNSADKTADRCHHLTHTFNCIHRKRGGLLFPVLVVSRINDITKSANVTYCLVKINNCVLSCQTAVALVTEMLLSGTKGVKLGVLHSSPMV